MKISTYFLLAALLTVFFVPVAWTGITIVLCILSVWYSFREDREARLRRAFERELLIAKLTAAMNANGKPHT